MENHFNDDDDDDTSNRLGASTSSTHPSSHADMPPVRTADRDAYRAQKEVRQAQHPSTSTAMKPIDLDKMRSEGFLKRSMSTASQSSVKSVDSFRPIAPPPAWNPAFPAPPTGPPSVAPPSILSANTSPSSMSQSVRSVEQTLSTVGEEMSANNTPVSSPPMPSYTLPALSSLNLSDWMKREPGITVHVVGSRIRSVRSGSKGEEAVFTLSVQRDAPSATTRWIESRFLASTSIDNDLELHQVEKTFSDVSAFDHRVRRCVSASKRGSALAKAFQDPLARACKRLPDKSLFTRHAPHVVDVRKYELDRFLSTMVSAISRAARQDPVGCKDIIRDTCHFLETDRVAGKSLQDAEGMNGTDTLSTAPKRKDPWIPTLGTGHKEGYLVKRGKSFGGWKTRWFTLQPPGTLDYFEYQGGPHLGTISISKCQVARHVSGLPPTVAGNNPSAVSNDQLGPDSPYRHAFMVLEQKKSGQLTRHILCAESDADRDSWVDMLSRYVDHGRPITPKSVEESFRERGVSLQGQQLPSLSQRESSDATCNDVPTKKDSRSSLKTKLRKMSTGGGKRPDAETRHISSPATGSVDRDKLAKGLPPLPPMPSQLPHPPTLELLPGTLTTTTANDASQGAAMKKTVTMTVATTRKAPEPLVKSPTMPMERASQEGISNNNVTGKKEKKGFFSRIFGSSDRNGEPAHGPKTQFGVPIEQAVSVASIKPGYECPVVIHRCIEYLDANKAEMEEGIYRLSGSSQVIQKLKQKFDQHGDYNILKAKEKYDIHAVSGLLKLYLRELPSSVLTRALHMDFVRVVELQSRASRVNRLGQLVSDLPLANYTLLRCLVAHLIRVISQCEVNKMNVRNIGIVFSPTLGLPAAIFTLLVSEFEYIFFITDDGSAAPIRLEDEQAEALILEVLDEPVLNESTPTSPVSTQMDSNAALGPPNSPGSPQTSLRSLKDKSLLLDANTGRTNRNSLIYAAAAPELVMKEVELHIPTMTEEEVEDSMDSENEADEHISVTPSPGLTPEPPVPETVLASFPDPPQSPSQLAPSQTSSPQNSQKSPQQRNLELFEAMAEKLKDKHVRKDEFTRLQWL